MATTINKVVSLVNKQFDQDGNAKKKTVEELQDAMGAWEHYVVSGEVHSILFIQYDNDIIKKVNDIEDEYIAFCSNINKAKELQSKEVEEAKRSQGKIWEMVFEVQELINKKLEEL
jgi:S-adenosylmethionine synthetase